ncbi:MAG: anti-sigma factor domain-containing protein [Bryobacteraceae bacterium]
MTCEELREDYELYTLGSSEEPATGELREHLQRQCGNCLPGVRSAAIFTSKLSAAVPIVEPPARLRKRVLALVNPGMLEHGGRAWSWGLGLAASVLAVSTVFLALTQNRLSRELARERTIAQQRQTEIATLDESLSLLTDPNSQQIIFGQGAPAPPRGKIFVNPSRGVVFLAANLPGLQAGQAYEMWMIPKTGNPVAAGVFKPQQDGTALHLRPGALANVPWGAVAVSVEPDGGSPQPTTTPMIVAPIASR